MSRGGTEETLGVLLRMLRPAPAAWVEAAQELPVARKALDEIVARAESDLAFRAALIADLEAALQQAGYEPGPLLVDGLRAYLA
jgi:hypothetical protein